MANDITIFDEVFEGLDMTASPASNAGDPLSIKNGSSTLKSEINQIFGDDEPVNLLSIDTSEESEKMINDNLEYFSGD